MLLCASLAAAAFGCRQQASASADLKKDAGTKLETAASVMKSADTAPPPSSDAAPAAIPAVEMKQAVEAYKGGKLDDAVTRLQNLRATSSMSPQQRMALNDAMAAVMTDIYAQAAKGDARAIQAVKLYEKMQTQRR